MTTAVRRIYDVTRPLSPATPVWPGDPEVAFAPVFRIDAGDGFNLAAVRLGTHAGTHVDAPSHFVEGGVSVDRLAPEVLIGPCWVIDLSDAGRVIGAAALQALGLPARLDRVLIRTRSATAAGEHEGAFDTGFAGLTEDAARWLLDRGVALVGIDAASIEPYDAEGDPVHHLLLGAGVPIVENLDLSDVPPGEYLLACLPLRLAGLDGAPARVVLIDDGVA